MRLIRRGATREFERCAVAKPLLCHIDVYIFHSVVSFSKVCNVKLFVSVSETIG